MRKCLILSLAVALSFIFSACSGVKYPNCKTDKDCTEHQQVCVMGQCQECGKDGDCPAGKKCLDNRCVEKDACNQNTDCPRGRCLKGKCAEADACLNNGDCSVGETCESGKCQAKPERTCVEASDCAEGETCISGKCVVGVGDCAFEVRVFFDFDQDTIREDAKPSLDKNVACMRKNPKMEIRVEGHCDERGSTEYNLSLGERRANAVKKYLTNSGIETKRVKIISYGEERPMVEGGDETSFSKNRRDEFVITFE